MASKEHQATLLQCPISLLYPLKTDPDAVPPTDPDAVPLTDPDAVPPTDPDVPQTDPDFVSSTEPDFVPLANRDCSPDGRSQVSMPPLRSRCTVELKA